MTANIKNQRCDPHSPSLATATTYYLKVLAVDTGNQTTASNEVTATTPSDDSNTPAINATIEMEYNLADKVVSVRDRLGTTTATYDALNRDLTNTDVYGRTIQYEYDQNGSRSALIYHDGTRVEYTYDAANRLLNVKRGADILAAYQYDPAGNISRQDNLNGTYTINTVDMRNRITNISHKKADQTLFLGLSYLYDSGGNRIREKENNGTYRDFFYDSKNQLTRETKRTIVGGEDAYGSAVDDPILYDYSYTFDAVGNRLTYKDEVTQTTTAYTYNNMNQMLTAGNTNFGYDDNGNMISKTTNGQTTTQSWDVFGKLLKLSNPDGSVVKFVYDGVGHRVKRWRSNGNETVFFVNDKSGDLVQLLSELDGSGTLVARYTLGNTLIAMDRGGQTYSYHFDVLGSTRELRNPQSAIANAYAFDAYGNVLSASETATNPYQFVAAFGYYSDPDTGLLYLRARYYSPSIGRFVSLDSYVGQENDPGSLHRYSYCRNAPLVFADPSGHLNLSSGEWYSLGLVFAFFAIGRAISAEALLNTGYEKVLMRAGGYASQATFLAGAAIGCFSESLIGLDLSFADDVKIFADSMKSAVGLGGFLAALADPAGKMSFASGAISALLLIAMMTLGALIAADFAFEEGR